MNNKRNVNWIKTIFTPYDDSERIRQKVLFLIRQWGQIHVESFYNGFEKGLGDPKPIIYWIPYTRKTIYIVGLSEDGDSSLKNVDCSHLDDWEVEQAEIKDVEFLLKIYKNAETFWVNYI